MHKTTMGLPGKPALLIIDMQNDFVKPGGPLPVAGAQDIIPAIADILYDLQERTGSQYSISCVFTGLPVLM